MADGYLKGQFDKGELAGKIVALVIFDNKEAAFNFLKVADKTNVKSDTVHEIVASHYDIDYDLHKILIYPAEKVNNGDI